MEYDDNSIKNSKQAPIKIKVMKLFKRRTESKGDSTKPNAISKGMKAGYNACRADGQPG